MLNGQIRSNCSRNSSNVVNTVLCASSILNQHNGHSCILPREGLAWSRRRYPSKLKLWSIPLFWPAACYSARLPAILEVCTNDASRASDRIPPRCFAASNNIGRFLCRIRSEVFATCSRHRTNCRRAEWASAGILTIAKVATYVFARNIRY